MQTKFYYLWMICLLLWCSSCNHQNQPVVPQYDTTYVQRIDTTIVPYIDTTLVPGMRVDTISSDTSITQKLIELQNDQMIIGYCYGGFSTLPDAFLNTHICYSFARLNMSTDSVYKGITIDNETMFKRCVALKKKNPNLKVQLSFANSAQGGGFSRMTSVPEYRKQFAKDCRKLCEDRGIDGVDLDWEWPGMAYNPAYLYDPLHDVDNYTALFKDIRAEFGQDYLLTCAGPDKNKEKVSGGGWRYMDLTATEPYLNWFNMMCYDFSSCPQPHNAWKCTSAYWDIMRTYQQYKLAGIPQEKCVLGVAFYGRHEFDNDKEWMYKEINDVLLVKFPSVYTRVYNKTWQVPVLYKNGAMFCSYDDTVSIAYKGQWAIDRGMKGLMYWEVEGDNARKDLQRACYKSQKQQLVQDTTITYVTDSIPTMDTIFTPVLDTILIPKTDTIITKKN